MLPVCEHMQLLWNPLCLFYYSHLSKDRQRLLIRFDFIECFTTTFLRAHSWRVIVRPLGPLTNLVKVGHQRRYTHIDHLHDSRFTGGNQSAPVVIHSLEIVQGSVVVLNIDYKISSRCQM